MNLTWWKIRCLFFDCLGWILGFATWKELRKETKSITKIVELMNRRKKI